MLFNYQEFLDGIDRKAYHEGAVSYTHLEVFLRT